MTPDFSDDSLLHLAVFGPGYGESIVIRIPGGAWVVVDGCVVSDVSPAIRLLDLHAAECACAILTHPHLDHALGLAELLQRSELPLVGCAPFSPPATSWVDSVDGEEQLRRGVVEHLLAAIQDIQESRPEAYWELLRGESREIGAARFTALHPDSHTVERLESTGGDRNRLSTPMLVEWEDLRLLLGSDVLKQDWRSIGGAFADLHLHGALKVPHHASRAAQHKVFAENAQKSRLWIATPFNRGRAKLPRFEDDQGIAWLLRYVDRVHLTGLPLAHDLQGEVPFSATRTELRDGSSPRPLSQDLGCGLVLALSPTTSSALDCAVAASFSANGDLVNVTCGPGSVVLSE